MYNANQQKTNGSSLNINKTTFIKKMHAPHRSNAYYENHILILWYLFCVFNIIMFCIDIIHLIVMTIHGLHTAPNYLGFQPVGSSLYFDVHGVNTHSISMPLRELIVCLVKSLSDSYGPFCPIMKDYIYDRQFFQTVWKAYSKVIYLTWFFRIVPNVIRAKKGGDVPAQ